MPSTAHRYAPNAISTNDPDAALADHAGVPGKRTLTSRFVGRMSASIPAILPSRPAGLVVQREALDTHHSDPFVGILPGPHVDGAGAPRADGSETSAPHAIAAAGVAGSGGPLPHLATIQAAFGHHDISGVRAHTDGAAANAAGQLGARAYATGHDLAFASANPDLHTAAHEAAHVVQQRGGVQLKAGFGADGDVYERHADAVADAVVRGESAAQLLDSMAARGGSAATGPSIQRKPAAAALAPLSGANELQEHDEAGPLIAARSQIMSAQGSIRILVTRAASGQLAAPAAVQQVVAHLQGIAIPLQLIGDNHRRVHGQNPLRRFGRGLRSPDQNLQLERADETLAPLVVESLDLVAANVLALADVLPAAAPERQLLTHSLGALSRPGALLGWAVPATTAAANARRYAHEACPDDGPPSPRSCTLTVQSRVSMRAYVIDHLNTVAALYIGACKKAAASFQAAIDADQRVGELVATFIAEGILLAITGPVGGVILGTGASAAAEAAAATAAKSAAATAATSAAAAAEEVGVSAAPSAAAIMSAQLADDAGKFAADLGKSMAKTSLRVPKALGVGVAPGDERRDTIAALDDLGAQFKARIAATKESLNQLDDNELATLDGRLRQYDTSVITTHVRAFADAYVKQVGPIGHEPATSLNVNRRFLAARSMYRAARIALPGGRTRLALVEHVTDTPAAAKARHVGRAALVGVDRAVGDGDDGLLLGPAYRAQQDAWVKADASEVIFIRWIDDPRMQALAAPDAFDVPASAVSEFPSADDLMPGLAAPPAPSHQGIAP